MSIKWQRILLFSINAILVVIFFCSLLPLQNSTHSTLPTLNINLSGITLEQIITGSKKAKHYNNSISITSNNTITSYSNVTLNGRGNSTWGWPKSPFQIKFSNDTNLLEMNAAKRWILLTNFLDKSHLRNDTAFFFAQMLNMNYSPNGRFVNLYIDNENQGLYYITEKIEIDKNRLPLKNQLGIIAEIENLHASTEICYTTEMGTCLVIQDSASKDNESSAMKDFLINFSALEQASKNGDYNTVQELADVESLAQYFLLSEFTANPDAYSSSYFFYKDGPLDKIHAGPGWDFDLSMGNRVWLWTDDDNYYSPYTNHLPIQNSFDTSNGTNQDPSSSNAPPNLIYNLLSIPDFQLEIEKVYRKYIANHKDEILQHLSQQIATIKDAAVEDIAKWQQYDSLILETIAPSSINDSEQSPENTPLDTTIDNDILHSSLSPAEVFDLETNSLYDWVSKRLDYLDYTYNSIKHFTKSLASI